MIGYHFTEKTERLWHINLKNYIGGNNCGNIGTGINVFDRVRIGQWRVFVFLLAAIHLVFDLLWRLVHLLSFKGHASALGECT